MPNPAIPWPGRFASRHGSLVFGGREVTHVAREEDSEVSSARKEVGVVNLSCRVERKDRRLPRFMVVPAQLLDGWQIHGTTVVEAAVNGVAVGRRSLKRWDDDRWFVELSQPMCERAAIDTGDRVKLSLRLASDELPLELAALLARSRRAQAAWAKLTPAQQRMLREEVFAAQSTEARRRRAARGLGASREGSGERGAADQPGR